MATMSRFDILNMFVGLCVPGLEGRSFELAKTENVYSKAEAWVKGWEEAQRCFEASRFWALAGLWLSQATCCQGGPSEVGQRPN